jgi:AraC family transcriptional regulator
MALLQEHEQMTSAPDIPENQKHFLTGLQAAPPPNHIWQDHSDYSIYSADQHRCVWNQHTHDCTQITVALDPALVRAEWQATAGRVDSREMDGNMVWVIPPGIPHSVHWNRRANLVHIYLDNGFFSSVMQDAIRDAASALTPSMLVRDPFLVELAKDLRCELETGAANELFTKSIATLTANHLVRRYSSKPGAEPVYRGGLGPARKKRVLQFIRENLGSHLSLEQMAEVAGVSPNYFIALFRQSTGMTPHRYVLRQRVKYAQELMANSSLPLIEVARQSGFQDQSQFTTTFRRACGVTPGKYKRQI